MKIAIVEDQAAESDLLQKHLARFARENDLRIEALVFRDGVDFLTGYSADYDAVFMDICMTHMDGMETARRLREVDDAVPLVFITTMKQYAINGYSVGAFDFIVKPVSYVRLEAVLRKLRRILEKRSERELILRTREGVRKLRQSEIYYVEIRGHDITYHTQTGDVDAYGTLKETEANLGGSFARCNNCYLVNLKYVTAVGKDEVTVGGYKVQLSQRRRKDLMDALIQYGGSQSWLI